MTRTGFFMVPASDAAVAELSTSQPANVFATAEFFAARRQLRYVPWIIGIRGESGKLECGCGAFIRKGRINISMEVTSLPNLSTTSPFWDGVRHFCKQQGVTLLSLETFGSESGGELPVIGTNVVERERSEFVLDLRENLPGLLGSNHKRNVKRGEKAGLVVQRSNSRENATHHEALISLSMTRRKSRGEDVANPNSNDILELLQSGAGELFQAISDTGVMSSVMVLRAQNGAYYQSAGTSPEGMAVGASHFLIHNISKTLASEGVEVFNLGGADDQSTLARFKEGFGAKRHGLKASTCYTGSALRRRVARVLELMTTERQTLKTYVFGSRQEMIVYAVDPAIVCEPQVAESLEFRPISSEELNITKFDDVLFGERQTKRLLRFGASFAYGVFADGKLAHISWLLPSDAMAKDDPRVFKAQTGVAEITCCETLPSFRGLGIYGYAIRNLLHLAGQQGIERVVMKTDVTNKASQSGIEKAGLSRLGSAELIALPLTKKIFVRRHFG